MLLHGQKVVHQRTFPLQTRSTVGKIMKAIIRSWRKCDFIEKIVKSEESHLPITLHSGQLQTIVADLKEKGQRHRWTRCLQSMIHTDSVLTEANP